MEGERAAQLSDEEDKTVDPARAESPLPLPFAGLPVETKSEPVPDHLFDADFYLSQLPDPAAAARAPRRHFAEHGRAAGYAPSIGAV